MITATKKAPAASTTGATTQEQLSFTQNQYIIAVAPVSITVGQATLLPAYATSATVKCATCRGHGWLGAHCPVCKGTGRVYRDNNEAAPVLFWGDCRLNDQHHGIPRWQWQALWQPEGPQALTWPEADDPLWLAGEDDSPSARHTDDPRWIALSTDEQDALLVGITDVLEFDLYVLDGLVKAGYMRRYACGTWTGWDSYQITAEGRALLAAVRS